MLSRNGTTYFTVDELKCKASGLTRLAPGFGEHLIDLRIKWGKPMIVNSACRSFQHNKDVGGNARSLHVYDKPFWPTQGCCAIDISCTDPIRRAALCTLALSMGWWVGVNEKFLHLDRRMDFGIAESVGIFTY